MKELRDGFKMTNIIEGNLLNYYDLEKPPTITEKRHTLEFFSDKKLSREFLMKEAKHACFHLPSVRIRYSEI